MISESRLTLHTITLRFAALDNKFGVRVEDAMMHALEAIPGMFSPDDSDQGPAFTLYQIEFDEFTSLDGEARENESIVLVSFSAGRLIPMFDDSGISIMDALATMSTVIRETAPMLRYIRSTEMRTYQHTESVNLPF